MASTSSTPPLIVANGVQPNVTITNGPTLSAQHAQHAQRLHNSPQLRALLQHQVFTNISNRFFSNRSDNPFKAQQPPILSAGALKQPAHKARAPQAPPSVRVAPQQASPSSAYVVNPQVRSRLFRQTGRKIER